MRGLQWSTSERSPMKNNADPLLRLRGVWKIVRRVGFSFHKVEKLFHRVFHSILEIFGIMQILYVALKNDNTLILPSNAKHIINTCKLLQSITTRTYERATVESLQGHPWAMEEIPLLFLPKLRTPSNRLHPNPRRSGR